MNQQLFEQRFSSLYSVSKLDNTILDKLKQFIIKAGDWDMYRINPFRWAKNNGFEIYPCLDVFVHAAKKGILSFEWDEICPKCGAVTNHEASIASLSGQDYHCATCDSGIESDLSSYVEVAFFVDPSIRQLAIDPYVDFISYRTYHISPSYLPPEGFADYFANTALQTFDSVESDESKKIVFKAETNMTYRVVSLDYNLLNRIIVNNEKSEVPQIVDLDIFPSGFSSEDINLSAGEITLQVHNHLSHKIGIKIFKVDQDKLNSFFPKGYNGNFDDFLSAKILLNNQSFRELYRIENLPEKLKLKVSEITILFTDLKGSTALYEETGDAQAYSLVQEHFDLLKESTHSHNGALIKTIGDAIMAAFSNPLDAVRAAEEMRNKIIAFQKAKPNYELAIKIGCHSGTAMAVQANEILDYFGQTVNTAARVQGLADSNEIWMTEEILSYPGVSDFIMNAGLEHQKQEAHLKGISKAKTVYRCLA